MKTHSQSISKGKRSSHFLIQSMRRDPSLLACSCHNRRFPKALVLFRYSQCLFLFLILFDGKFLIWFLSVLSRFEWIWLLIPRLHWPDQGFIFSFFLIYICLLCGFGFLKSTPICLDFGGYGEDLEVLLVPGILTPNRWISRFLSPW